MNTNLTVQPARDPLRDKVASSQQAWKRLGMTAGSVAPRVLERTLLVLVALAGLVWYGWQ